MSDDKSDEAEFLNRWSRRKAESRTEAVMEREAADISTDLPPLPEGEMAALDPGADAGTAAQTGADTETEEIPPEIADIDIDSLDYNSDFTVFMKDNVPEFIRRRALRQLWRSNPVLANVDGLNDYDDDFTDAALVVKGLKSAYKIGKGYLTDEDRAATEADAAGTAEAKAIDEIDEADKKAETGDPDTDSDENAAKTADAETGTDEPQDTEHAGQEDEADGVAPDGDAGDIETADGEDTLRDGAGDESEKEA